MAVLKDPRSLLREEPFVTLFPIEPEVLELVKDSIKADGFRADRPILTWRRGDDLVVIDGHTRLQAALDLRLKEVDVTVRRFPGVEEALDAAIAEQIQRRNLTREQLVTFVLTTLELSGEGAQRPGPRADGRSAAQLAKRYGVGTRTIERARALLASGRADLIEQVKAGQVGLQGAAEALHEDGPVHEDGPDLPDDPQERPVDDRVQDAARLLDDPEVAAAFVATSSRAKRHVAHAVAADAREDRQRWDEIEERRREQRQRQREHERHPTNVAALSRFKDALAKAGTIRWFDLNGLVIDAADPDARYDVDDVSRLMDRLAELGEWALDSAATLSALLDVTAIRRKIHALGQTRGRTEAEIETARRLAERLQGKLDARGEGD